MPFTPLHCGPGLALTGLMPRVSFMAFALGQVLIDIEPLVYMVQGDWPLHRFFHTYLGALLLGGVVMVLTPVSARPLLVWWNGRLSPVQARWLGVDPVIPWSAAALGAWLGTLSHVGLDSMVHMDMRPWSPWSDSSGPLEWVSYGGMTELCLALGVVGMGIMVLRRWRPGARQDDSAESRAPDRK